MSRHQWSALQLNHSPRKTLNPRQLELRLSSKFISRAWTVKVLSQKHFLRFYSKLQPFLDTSESLSEVSRSGRKISNFTLREVVQKYLNKIGFNFYENRTRSFWDMIFIVQILFISIKILANFKARPYGAFNRGKCFRHCSFWHSLSSDKGRKGITTVICLSKGYSKSEIQLLPEIAHQENDLSRKLKVRARKLFRIFLEKPYSWNRWPL